MPTTWDLAAYDRNNQLVLVVEAKGKLDASPEWAAQLRSNIFAHGTYPNAPYFLMIFPDQFYLWKNTDSKDATILPAYVIDARPILQPYFEQSGITAAQLSRQSLELIAASWLNDIMHRRPDELDASQQWLIDSGLHNAVVGGSLTHKVPA